MMRWVRRLLCRHHDIHIQAATGAAPHSTDNVSVGVTVMCKRCRRTWAGDVVAGLAAQDGGGK